MEPDRGYAEPYDPELYELIHRGTAGDLAFYRRAVAGAGAVLELGCGYGRVLEALAHAHPGVDLHGLDSHPGLLNRARKRLGPRVRLLHADIKSLPLARGFDVVLAPFSVLWCLDGQDGVGRCFEGVSQMLSEGGRLVFDAYAADGFHGNAEPEPGDEDPVFVADIHREEDGAGLRVFERTQWRPSEQAFTVRYDHYRLSSGATADKEKTEVIEHRYLLMPQLLELLRGAGFRQVQAWGGFEGQPWDEEAEQLVVEATR